jgi:hypothetical protein
MNNTCISGVLVIAASAVLAAQAPARFDRAAEAQMSGTVKVVIPLRADDGSIGVHLELRTVDAIVDVRVAPALFVGEQNFWFDAGDALVVTGALAEGGDAIVAKTIQKGARVLTLRSADGTPKWVSKTEGSDGCGTIHPPMQRTTLH